jgi:hypothetical protein
VTRRARARTDPRFGPQAGPRPSARALALAALHVATAVATACAPPDPRTRALVAERDVLRREVAGMRRLAAAFGAEGATPVALGPDDVLLVVGDSLVRALLDAALPRTVPLPGQGAEVRLERATTVLGANVARVTLVGTVRRLRWPYAGATVRVRGAVADLAVDETSTLHARLAVDEVVVSDPTGVAGALRGWAEGALQEAVDRGLPELAAALPRVAIPVRLDETIALPGFGPEGPLHVSPVAARVRVTVRHVAAWDGQTWAVLRLDRTPFAPTDVPRRARGREAPTAAAGRAP